MILLLGFLIVMVSLVLNGAVFFLVWLISKLLGFSFLKQLLWNIYDGWVGSLSYCLKKCLPGLELLGDETKLQKGSCLMLSNHRSWMDIMVLYTVFYGKLPSLMFVMKKELIWE